MLSRLLYQAFIFFYPRFIQVVSPFNQKAKRWIKGRNNVLEAMQTNILPNTFLIWMHCASLGEFEQGRPLLEKLRERYPSYKILLTFFSPSGYEVRKDYNGADFIYYLPMDSKKNAQTFLNITNP
ncbi:MAG TPA: glycosyltransferase N-terminal domain-containing protein, partial [Segetibacter sp.]